MNDSFPMKELNPANWVYWFGLITVICLLLPIVAVLVKQKFSPVFLALAVYFFTTFLYNLLLVCFPDFPKQVRQYIGLTNNFMDAPLMLLFMQYFAYTDNIKKILKYSLLIYFLFELGVIALYGFSVKSTSIFSGPGILLVLSFAFLFFAHYVRNAISQKTGYSKTLMISGVLFAYAVYFMVYLFFYILKTPHKADALLIYFLSSSIAAILLAFGLFTEKNNGRKKTTQYPRVAF